MTASAAEGSSKRLQPFTMPLVLMYHSVSPYDDDPYEVTMTPQRFEQQMSWLRRRGLRGVSMRELLGAVADDRTCGLVGLTFDDGYEDFITHALPILRRYRFTATAFVLAGRLGGHNVWSEPGPRKPLLAADQVREVAQAGIEIGSHGLEHVSLPEVDDAQLDAETVCSRAILEELVGQDVPGFCYPYGHLDPRVVEAVHAAHYDYACAVWPSPSIGSHALPRTYVHDRDMSWRLDAKRVVSWLTVRNRIAVRRHRGGV